MARAYTEQEVRGAVAMWCGEDDGVGGFRGQCPVELLGGAMECSRRWLVKLAFDVEFGDGIIAMMPIGVGADGREVLGSLVLLGTPAYRRRGREVQLADLEMAESDEPCWQHYECFVLPGVLVGSVRELQMAGRAPAWQGGFEEYLNGNPRALWWRAKYGRQPTWWASHMRFGLRELLVSLGCVYWVEVYCARTCEALRGMILYEKVFTPANVGGPLPAYARAYLLNAGVPWWCRRDPDVHMWWRYESMVNLGLRRWSHWIMEPPRDGVAGLAEFW